MKKIKNVTTSALPAEPIEGELKKDVIASLKTAKKVYETLITGSPEDIANLVSEAKTPGFNDILCEYFMLKSILEVENEL